MQYFDRDSQYTSAVYQLELGDHHFIVSMSRTGNCLDNAAMEIFSDIMGFYNLARRHQALNYQ